MVTSAEARSRAWLGVGVGLGLGLGLGLGVGLGLGLGSGLGLGLGLGVGVGLECRPLARLAQLLLAEALGLTRCALARCTPAPLLWRAARLTVLLHAPL